MQIPPEVSYGQKLRVRGKGLGIKEKKGDQLVRITIEMEENGLISRYSDEDNKNIEYSLTDKGRKLNKVIYELAMFTLTTDLGDAFYDDERKIELKNIFKSTLIKE